MGTMNLQFVACTASNQSLPVYHSDPDTESNIEEMSDCIDKDRSADRKEDAKIKYNPDLLFMITYYTRYLLDVIYAYVNNFKHTLAYRVLFTTSQPAHVIMVIAIILVSALFFPFGEQSASITTPPQASAPLSERKPVTSKFTYLIYFTALSLHVGSQFWMTFVSGLSLYFNLARHAFGDVQRILFPRYFTLNCILSAITLIQFGRLHGRLISEKDMHTLLQVFALFLCFTLELLIRLYLVPTVLDLIHCKTVIEKSAGIGEEVGHYNLGPLLQCPHYMGIHRAFRKVHMYTAMGNVISMMCSAFHMYYLANKWIDHLGI